MRADSEIRHDVLQELDFDPKLGSRDIAVAVRDGVVTLAGFVHGFGEKSQAEMDARRVAGVVGPANSAGADQAQDRGCIRAQRRDRC